MSQKSLPKNDDQDPRRPYWIMVAVILAMATGLVPTPGNDLHTPKPTDSRNECTVS
jgi:hypothetical protein